MSDRVKESTESASAQALAAVRAEKNADRWGDFATTRYAQKNGVPYPMFLVALRIELVRAKRAQQTKEQS